MNTRQAKDFDQDLFMEDYSRGLMILRFSSRAFAMVASGIGYPVGRTDIPTAQVVANLDTNRVEFQINPNFIRTMESSAIAAVIAHETYHVLLDHLREVPDREAYPNYRALADAHECIINDGLPGNLGLETGENTFRGVPRHGQDFAFFSTRDGYDFIAGEPEDAQPEEGDESEGDESNDDSKGSSESSPKPDDADENQDEENSSEGSEEADSEASDDDDSADGDADSDDTDDSGDEDGSDSDGADSADDSADDASEGDDAADGEASAEVGDSGSTGEGTEADGDPSGDGDSSGSAGDSGAEGEPGDSGSEALGSPSEGAGAPGDASPGDSCSGPAIVGEGVDSMTPEQLQDALKKLMEASLDSAVEAMDQAGVEADDQVEEFFEHLKDNGLELDKTPNYGDPNARKGFEVIDHLSGMNMNWVELLAAINPRVKDTGRPKARDSWHQPRRKMIHSYPQVILPTRRRLDDPNRRKGDSIPTFVLALDMSFSIPERLLKDLASLASSTPDHLIRTFPITWADNWRIFDPERPREIVHRGGTRLQAVKDYADKVALEEGVDPYVLVITDGGFIMPRTATPEEMLKKWYWMGIENGDTRRILMNGTDSVTSERVFDLKDFV